MITKERLIFALITLLAINTVFQWFVIYAGDKANYKVTMQAHDYLHRADMTIVEAMGKHHE